jgi:hypothetical protein
MKHHLHLSLIPYPQKKIIVKNVKIVKIRIISIKFYYWKPLLKFSIEN